MQLFSTYPNLVNNLTATLRGDVCISTYHYHILSAWQSMEVDCRRMLSQRIVIG